MLIPEWKFAKFWPSLVYLEGNVLPFIVNHIESNITTNFFITVSNENCILPKTTISSGLVPENLSIQRPPYIYDRLYC